MTPSLKSFLDVALSFKQGIYRFWGAEAAVSRLMCALGECRISESAGLDGPSSNVLQQLARIPYSSYDSLAYVTNVSHLVYATTLLDTFLSDTTLFLFLLIPQSMGKNQQVPLRTLIDASSRNAALSQAAMARSREIGYLPLSGRIQFLRDTFGLQIELSKDTEYALDHYSSTRNAAVHDQGIFELKLDENGSVVTRQKTCPLHPTNITGDDVHNAINAYEQVVLSVAKAVFTQVLKQQDHPAVQKLYKTNAADLSTDNRGSTDGSSA